MTQTLHQRTAIRAYNNVVALRPQRMPDAWRHTDRTSVPPVPLVAVPPPQPTAAQRLNERLWKIHDERMGWAWTLLMAVIVVADIYITVAALAGGAK